MKLVHTKLSRKTNITIHSLMNRNCKGLSILANHSFVHCNNLSGEFDVCRWFVGLRYMEMVFPSYHFSLVTKIYNHPENDVKNDNISSSAFIVLQLKS